MPVIDDPWKILEQKNHIEIDEIDKKFVELNISGENNTVIIKKISPWNTGKITISIAGNNCKFIFEENIYVSQFLNIVIGQIHPNFGKIENVYFKIGQNTTFENANITLFNSNSYFDIGENCMFSFGINIFHTDAHPIYSIKSKQIINKVKILKIADHCWIGAGVTILKNVELGHDSIVGWGSVVSKNYAKDATPDVCRDESGIPCNCIIAGNPAHIVAHGVTWDSNGSQGYIQNQI